MKLLLKLIVLNDIINLQDHLDQLGGKQELLLLGDERITHMLDLHVIDARVVAVNSQSTIVFCHMARFDLGNSLNWRVTRVLSQSQRNGIQSSSKSTHGILLNSGNLVCSLGYSQGTSNLGCSTSVNNTIITDKVTNSAKSIMQTTLGFVNDLNGLNYR